jgi:ribosome-binding ATPase YchF (GTP1/OBG family)
MIIACNKIDMPGAADNFTRIENEFPDHMLIACSAESELALREAAKDKLINYIPGENTFKIEDESKLSDKQKLALNFIKSNILDKFGSTGVQSILDKSVFDILKYIPIFPGGVNKLADSDGNVLPDCFLMPPGSTALSFAYKLHSDFGDNFIRAIDVKTKMTVGKEHLLKSGDVVEIISGK